MKLLLIANGDFFSTYGGGQIYVKNLVDEMIHQQMTVCVFSFVNKQSDVPYEKKNYKGIDLYEFYHKDTTIIINRIKEIVPDVIHAHAQKGFFAGISKELNIPYIVTAHHGGITCPAGALMNTKDEICRQPVSVNNCLKCVLRNIKGGLIVYPFLRRLPLKWRLKLGRLLNKLPFIYFLTPYGQSSLQIEKKMTTWRNIVDSVDSMIAPSYTIVENMIQNGLSEDKIKVIPHGIPCLQDVSNSLHCTSHPIKFFYVGRIGYIKGIHLLLKAFVNLLPDQCELHLIGDLSGKYGKELMKKYKDKSNIFFHGKIKPNEVLEYIQQFDVLVHPAICLEVYGLTISEALSQGKPVIATRCGGAEMQIRDKENGLLIASNHVNELRQAMQWMIDHPEELVVMKQDSPKYVVSIESHLKQIYNIYKELCLLSHT